LLAFKAALNARFECKDGGELNYFLGIQIYRDRQAQKLYLCQSHYIEALLERYDMAKCNPASSPLPHDFEAQSATDEEWALAANLDFPALAGALLHIATITRPDLALPAPILCRYIGKWSMEHWRAAKHLLRYLRGTSEYCLTYDAEGGQQMMLGYSDSD
jgi:hypothetical protein